MHLTKEENDMLGGKHGYPIQKCMEILVSLGDCYDAEKMVPVSSTHLIAHRSAIMRGGMAFIKEMADRGGKFVPFTTLDVPVIDTRLRNDPVIGVSEEYFKGQVSLTNDLARMGAFLANTCTPYLVANVPRFGQHCAWSESSAVIFANSVLGARTNREGPPSSLAAALTGRTPAYGYHLDHNRYGDLEISINTKLNGVVDYGTLGYFIGKVAEDKVPVLTGIPHSISWPELKMLGAAAATSGAVALYHIVGVTPEATTKKAAFGHKKNWPVFEFSKKELEETEASLDAARGDVELVVFGCPHLSIQEIREIAALLKSKKLKDEIELWVFFPRILATFAENMEYVKIIETSGARVITDSCPVGLSEHLIGGKRRKSQIVATNSAKLPTYMSSREGSLLHYGSTEKCIRAAVTGAWK
jgi:predicted aconitase